MKKAKKNKAIYPNSFPGSPEMNEAAAAYETLNVILGGKRDFHKSDPGDLDLVRLTREGIKKSSLRSLASYLGISMETMSSLLHTSHRNLQRKDDDSLLDTLKSERVLELAAFVRRGAQVIGSPDGFIEWLHSPLPVLENRKPVELLDTSFGIKFLSKVLGRLEQGVYS